MDFKELRSYVASVKYKSFTTAAEKLKISQPTISTHVRSLEDELGFRLIIRTAKNFELTPKGVEFYECAQNILKLWDDIADRWNWEETKTIRLGVSTIPSAYILPELLPGFEKQHEDVFFAICQKDSRCIIDAVRKGSYDIGMVGMKTDDETLEFHQFYEDRMVLITPINEHFLAIKEQETLPLHELLAEPMILREQGSGSRKSAELFLKACGISEEALSVTAQMNDLESIKNLVAGGLGVSIISEKAVQRELDSKRLLWFELPGEQAKRQFYLICQKDCVFKDYVKEFTHYVLSYYK